jgi:hypothetical protein
MTCLAAFRELNVQFNINSGTGIWAWVTQAGHGKPVKSQNVSDPKDRSVCELLQGFETKNL